MKTKLIIAAAAIFIFVLAGCGAHTETLSPASTDAAVSADTSAASQTPEESESTSFSAGSEAPGESTPEETAPPAESSTPEVSQQTPEGTKPPKPAETIPPATESIPPVTSEPPQETQKPTETQPPVTTEEPKTAYDSPFDMEAIKADCVAIGEGMGLQRDTSLTPDNATWWNPVTASQTSQGDRLKRDLRRYIESHTIENLAPYGMEAITYFNIHYEARGDGVYSIYFLFA